MARLLFNNHTTEQLNLPSRIEERCLLSPIFYAFYNTNLVHNETNRNILKLSSHHNTVFLDRDKTFGGMIKKLTRMMKARDCTLDWAQFYHLLFKIDKTALICFTRHRHGMGV